MAVESAASDRRRQMTLAVTRARTMAGLTQRELADRIGTSLLTVERLEAGVLDAAPFVERVKAASAGQPGNPRLVRPLPRSAGVAAHAGWRGRALAHARATRPGSRLVIGLIVFLVLVRFFSEVVHVLPSAATFGDVPLFFSLAAIAACSRRSSTSATLRAPDVKSWSVVFVGICVVATLANLARVAPGPVIVFLYGFLSPLGIYLIVRRLWVPGAPRCLTRLLVTLGVIEVAVVMIFDLPKFISTRNPDVMSGTFGDNAYQLVFFLLVLTALFAGLVVFEPKRLGARFAPLMFVLIAIIMFMAQYRALLPTTVATILLIGGLLSFTRGRGAIWTALMVMAFVGSFWYVASTQPTTKFTSTIESFRSDPWFFASSRIGALADVESVYSDNPRYVLTGTGPGTFSSRAWRTFADLSDTRTAVAAPYAGALNGGPYISDVAQKYTVPRAHTAPLISGSHAVTSPFSSYGALLAEVGIPGFAVVVGIYIWALLFSGRMMLISLRTKLPDDPLPALLLASTVAIFVLLQLAALDNWLEVTRLTFLSWALLAVAGEEFAWRHARRPLPGVAS